MAEIVEIEGTKFRVVELATETARQVDSAPNGPEIVPDSNAKLDGWEQ
jgi:hypothetical protein